MRQIAKKRETKMNERIYEEKKDGVSEGNEGREKRMR